MTPVSMRTLLDSGTGRLLGRTYSPPLSKTHYERVQRFEQHPVGATGAQGSGSGSGSGSSSSARGIPNALWDAQDPRLSMQELMELRQLARLQIAGFLHHELPIRFAHRIRDLDRLPYGLSEMPTIRAIQDQYCRSGEELQKLQVGGVFGRELS